ncbi:MAG: GNAT family N-acetyltransferase [Microbacterium gubbeenense]|uniref:GNAT family N-acetyltransferase n=1 Tax=Microbacterium gubbeenense TaxID=159896 RepID=UPI003F952BB6
MHNQLLATYDDQLRGAAEVRGSLTTDRLGPLWLSQFSGGRGFISYKDLDGIDHQGVVDLVAAGLAHFRDQTGVTLVEWKTRGHDRAPGLQSALESHGFAPDETESIMVGEASSLVVEVPLPNLLELRRAESTDDVWAMAQMQGAVFDDADWRTKAESTLERLEAGDDFELWIAVSDGAVISAGRLDPVEGTDFAGIWEGATLPNWRGRGIYRALTACRARAAISRGKSLLHSDSTGYSRPILERSGLVKISTTTPYVWERPTS